MDVVYVTYHTIPRSNIANEAEIDPRSFYIFNLWTVFFLPIAAYLISSDQLLVNCIECFGMML